MKRTLSPLTESLGLAFFVFAGIVSNFIIPPFQNPDEPQHFGLILTYSRGREERVHIEKEVISLMDSNSWWKFVGMGRPPVIPENFMKIAFLKFPDIRRELVGNTVLYHFLLGKIQNVFFKEEIRLSYYFCRLISILLMIGSVFLIYRSLGKISGVITRPIFLSSFLSILFLPQLVTTFVAVNPDSLSFFLSALFFYGFFSLVVGAFRIRYLILLFLASGLSFFADRSVFFLVIMLILSPFFWIKRKDLKRDLALVLIFFLASVVLASWVAWYTPDQFYDSLAALHSEVSDNLSGASKFLSMDGFNTRFFLFLSDSFFLKFGWMAFSPDAVFYYLWRTFISLSFLGAIIYLGKYRHLKKEDPDGPLSSPLIPKFFLFFMISIILQIAGLWIICGSKNILPEGRYLYPTIIPIAVLFWFGIGNFFSVFHKTAGRMAIFVLLIGEFLFLNYAIWNYIIPVFHLTIKSPHAGI